MCQFVPYGCDEWTLEKKVNLMTDSIEYLSQSFPISVGRDYHGSKVHERHSLFTYLINVTDMHLLLDRFGAEVVNYVNADGGNVLHDIVQNPNPECYFLLVQRLTINDLVHLANMKDRNDDLPIALNGDIKIFQHLMKYTRFTTKCFVKCVSNSLTVAKYIMTLLDEAGCISV